VLAVAAAAGTSDAAAVAALMLQQNPALKVSVTSELAVIL
jgi:hypothetical protein